MSRILMIILYESKSNNNYLKLVIPLNIVIISKYMLCEQM